MCRHEDTKTALDKRPFVTSCFRGNRVAVTLIAVLHGDPGAVEDLLDVLRSERLISGEHLLSGRARDRTREEVPLRVRAAEPFQLTRLIVALDAFRDHA